MNRSALTTALTTSASCSQPPFASDITLTLGSSLDQL